MTSLTPPQSCSMLTVDEHDQETPIADTNVEPHRCDCNLVVENSPCCEIILVDGDADIVSQRCEKRTRESDTCASDAVTPISDGCLEPQRSASRSRTYAEEDKRLSNVISTCSGAATVEETSCLTVCISSTDTDTQCCTQPFISVSEPCVIVPDAQHTQTDECGILERIVEPTGDLMTKPLHVVHLPPLEVKDVSPEGAHVLLLDASGAESPLL